MPRKKSTRYHPDHPSGTDAAGQVVTCERQIVAYLRKGAYRQIAAEAAGVPAAEVDRWMQLGDQPGKKQVRYRQFRDRVHQAEAQARIVAEMKMWEEDPKVWLTRGPGKETPDRKGWSGVVKPVPTTTATVNVLADPSWNQLWAQILFALDAFPEARAALADSIQPASPAKPPPRRHPPLEPPAAPAATTLADSHSAPDTA